MFQSLLGVSPRTFVQISICWGSDLKTLHFQYLLGVSLKDICTDQYLLGFSFKDIVGFSLCWGSALKAFVQISMC